MISLLLTGSDGQLGRLLQQQFASAGQYKLYARNKAQLDIADTSALVRQFQLIKPQVVINCAAFTAVDAAEREVTQCHAVNASAVEQLARLCRLYDSLLITLSSDYVFDGHSARPYTEQDVTAPLNQYGKSKQRSEYAARFAGKYITLRTSWLFSEYGSNFVTAIGKRALAGLPVAVVTDQFGGPTPANALADAIHLLVQQYAGEGALPYGLYHFSGYPYCSWYDLAKQIYHQVAPGHDNLVTPIASPFPEALALRPAFSCLDMSLFQRRFNYQQPDWQTELTKVVNKLAN